MSCGFWVGMDKVGSENPKTNSAVWSFLSGRPSVDPTRNCVSMLFNSSVNVWQWIDDNCTNSYYVGCRSDTNPMFWTVSNVTMTWYVAYAPNGTNSSGICPVGYHFDVPATSIQARNLAAVKNTNSMVVAIWVKLNDIDTEGTFLTSWSGIIPAVPFTIWDNVVYYALQAADKWYYIVAGFVVFFAICIPITFLVCRRLKKRRLQKGFKQFNDSVSLDDK